MPGQRLLLAILVLLTAACSGLPTGSQWGSGSSTGNITSYETGYGIRQYSTGFADNQMGWGE